MKLVTAGMLLAAWATPVLADTVPDIMPVYAVRADGQGVTVRVAPRGCTPRKGDLTVAVAMSGARPMLLIARKHAAPPAVLCPNAQAADISWSFADLGLDPAKPFSLANPLVVEP
jgi:hypothetical protein